MFRAKDYRRAESLEEAYTLNQKRSNVLVGGMMWLKMGNGQKGTVIDLSGLGLDGIEEDGEQFSIGCMCSLRKLETHEGLNTYFGGIFRECTRHIVGTQFRNGATVGGSMAGRFGFSDILTCLLVTDAYVELYKGGTVPLARFAREGCGRDILVRVLVKGQKASGLCDPAQFPDRFSGDCLRGGKKRRELLCVRRGPSLQGRSGGAARNRGASGRPGQGRGRQLYLWGQYAGRRGVPEASGPGVHTETDGAAGAGGKVAWR